MLKLSSYAHTHTHTQTHVGIHRRHLIYRVMWTSWPHWFHWVHSWRDVQTDVQYTAE